MIKKSALLALCLCALLGFSGCDGIFSAPGDLISPPKLEGSLSGLDEALQTAIGEKYEFAYPESGDYLSSCITKDLDGDGEDEALIFYIPKNDGVVHMNLFVRKDGGWHSVSDINTLSFSVDRVLFDNLCGDGKLEIVVSTRLYTSSASAAKQVLVYSYEDGALANRFQEECGDFAVCSMLGDGYRQIVTFKIDTAQNYALESGTNKATAATPNTARLCSLNTAAGQSAAVYIVGEARLDPGVSSIAAVTAGKVGEMNALYIDAALGNGSMATSLLIYDSKQKRLLNPLFDTASGNNSVTLRTSAVLSRDIDSDGVVEIPVSHRMADGNSSAEDMPVSWMAYENGKLTVKTEGYYNSVYKYYFSAPEKWLSAISVDAEDGGLSRVYTVYPTDKANAGARLCTVTVRRKQQSDSSSSQAAGAAYSSKEYDFYVKLSDAMPKDYAQGVQTVTDSFTVLE